MNRSLAGRYELLEPLGAGGMGEVWRATDRQLGREVAVKVLPEGLADEPRRRERFEREARAAARLHHQNILEVYDFGADEGRQFVVMERLEGADLAHRLVEGPVPWRDAVRITLQVARGLDAAHREGVVHRDLKPANLFLCVDGTVKILDFGLARLAAPDAVDGDDESRLSTLTETGAVVGTAGYMAPEQVRGHAADARSDLFSFGCVLHEMLSGKRPFAGGSSAEVMSAILRDEPEPIARPIPRSLRQLVDRCLRKEPGQRFGSAAEVAAALEAIRDSDEVELDAGPASSASRTPVRAAALAAGVGLAGLVAAWGVIVWQQSSRTTGLPPELDPNRIAVVPFVNRSSDPALDAVARRAADRIVHELGGIDELEVILAGPVAGFVPERGSIATETRGRAREVAAATSARWIVAGEIVDSSDAVELQLTMEDGRTGMAIRAFETVHTTREGLDPALETLSGWVFVTTMEELHPVLRFGAGSRIPDPAAFREYLAGLPNLGIDPAARGHLDRALELDPSFDRVRIFGAFAAWGLPDWRLSDERLQTLESRRIELTATQRVLVDACRWGIDGRWGGALGLLESLPDDLRSNPITQCGAVLTAMSANRPRVALGVFRDYRWDSFAPSVAHKIVSFQAARAHHRLGQHDEELAVLRRLWAEHGSFYGTVWYRECEAEALAAAGRIEECERTVAQALTEPAHWPTRYGEMMLAVAEELRAHGHAEASTRIAQRALDWFSDTELQPEMAPQVQECSVAILSFLGRHDEALRLARARAAEEPGCWPCRAEVGIEAASIGDRETALAVSHELAAIDEPFAMGRLSYARAAIAARLGDRSSAIRLLQQAVAAGFNDWERLHVDIDFDPLRGDPEFSELLRPKG